MLLQVTTIIGEEIDQWDAVLLPEKRTKPYNLITLSQLMIIGWCDCFRSFFRSCIDDADNEYTVLGSIGIIVYRY